MNTAEQARFHSLLHEIADNPLSRRMQTYIQHGTMTTYDHCVCVARESFKLSRLLHLRINERELIRGAFLHDYFLYDWHGCGDHLHGLHHPLIAMHNAKRDFNISEREATIIRTHMWPLTPADVPTTREAILVCIADKICALKETLHRKR